MSKNVHLESTESESSEGNEVLVANNGNLGLNLTQGYPSISSNSISASSEKCVFSFNTSESSDSDSAESEDPLAMTQQSNKAGNVESKKKPILRKKRNTRPIPKHITVLEGSPLSYQCNVCMKTFTTKYHSKYHEFCVSGEKPFKCETCGKSFVTKGHFSYHLANHTGDLPHVCNKCGKRFAQRSKLKRHLISHGGEKPFLCHHCGKVFASPEALKTHILIHTEQPRFICQYCSHKYASKRNLEKHLKSHFADHKFNCNHCSKSFKSQWTFDLHVRTHKDERPFPCDQCNKSFTSRKDLHRHFLTHTGDRPFKCNICERIYRRKDNLDRHIRKKHNEHLEAPRRSNSGRPTRMRKCDSKLQNNPVSSADKSLCRLLHPPNIITDADGATKSSETIDSAYYPKIVSYYSEVDPESKFAHVKTEEQQCSYTNECVTSAIPPLGLHACPGESERETSAGSLAHHEFGVCHYACSQNVFGYEIHNSRNFMKSTLQSSAETNEAEYYADNQTSGRVEKGTQCIPSESILTETGYVIKTEIASSQDIV